MKNYFSEKELKCKCGCEQYKFSEGTLYKLNQVREELNEPIKINSGYRCRDYNIKIGATQTHSSGQAVDISASRGYAYRLLALLLKHGFTGIGIKQKGDGRFIHADDLDISLRPTIWSY